MKCRKCETPLFLKPGPLPAWANPALAMVSTYWRYTQFDVLDPAPANTLVARPDPTRIAIGFSAGNNGGWLVAPHPRPDVSGWGVYTGNAGERNWFTLFEEGPLVCDAWYCTYFAYALGVYEVFTQL